MFEVNGYNIFYILVVTFLSSLVLVPLAKKIAIHINALDYPNKRKVHKKPMPRLGGLAIFGAFLVGYIFYGSLTSQMLSILIGSFIIIIMGIIDDINPVRAKYKLLTQIIAASVVVFYGKIYLSEAQLGRDNNIKEQIEKVNEILTDYEIKLSNPFEYFELVKDRFENFEWNDELRDNSKTFILQGSYSTRTKLKQYNTKCTYMLEQADRLQKKYGNKYNSVIEYAYKLLLKNLAHDGIYGCSTDLVHRENITRYEKILQIANTIIEELRLEYNFKTPIMQSAELIPEYKIVSKKLSVENSLLYDTQKIPVTEDFKNIYTLKYSPATKSELKIEVKNGKISVSNGVKHVGIEFVRFKDDGDTYNFGALEEDKGEIAEIYSYKNNIIKTSFFDVQVELDEMANFKIVWNNKLKNRLWQVQFKFKQPVLKTYSEDMDAIIERNFDPDYDMRKHLPQKRGVEVKTNFAPMQRYVGAQGIGIITKGLTEYEVKGKSLLITLLRSTGVISNPLNPSRSTPAGPPIEVPDAQQLGENSAEFSVAFFEPEDFKKYIDIVLDNPYNSTVRYGMYYYLLDSDNLPNNVKISLADESIDGLEDIIQPNQTRSVSIKINNNSENSVKLEIGALVGFEKGNIEDLASNGEVLIK